MQLFTWCWLRSLPPESVDDEFRFAVVPKRWTTVKTVRGGRYREGLSVILQEPEGLGQLQPLLPRDHLGQSREGKDTGERRVWW